MSKSIGLPERILHAAFAILAACVAGPAIAVDAGKGDDPAAYEPLPYVASRDEDELAPFAAERYAYDPAFANHGVFTDQFAGSPGYYVGQKAVRMANGDVIVAGSVYINGDYQLGLVRYSPSGRRKTWSSVQDAYARYSKQYVVFPNTASPDPALTGVADIRQYGGNLYVLATQKYRASNGLDKYQPAIVVFSAEGEFRGWWYIRIDDDVYNGPVAMDINSNGRLTLLAGNSGGGWWTRFWTARYKINADGVPILDTNYGNGGASMFEVPTSLSSCPAAAIGGLCPISGVDLAHEAGLVAPLEPAFYVAFTKKYDNSGDHDPCIAAFNSGGQLRTSFGTNGVKCYPFDDGGSNRDDEAVALHATFHSEFGGGVIRTVQDIYLLANVARQYNPGTGLLRLDSSGAQVAEFGGTGKLLWGGCGASCTVNLGAETPLALTVYGRVVAVAGHWKPQLVDQPQMTMVDSTSGTIASFEVLAIPSGDANYTSIVGDSKGFTAAGWARDGAAPSSNKMFVTSRLIPKRIADDTIFRYGHE